MVAVNLIISTITVNENALNPFNKRQRFSFKRHSRRTRCSRLGMARLALPTVTLFPKRWTLNTKVWRKIERREKDWTSSKHKQIDVTVSDKIEFQTRSTVHTKEDSKGKQALLRVRQICVQRVWRKPGPGQVSCFNYPNTMNFRLVLIATCQLHLAHLREHILPPWTETEIMQHLLAK